MTEVEPKPRNIKAKCLDCGATFPDPQKAYPQSPQTQVNLHLMHKHGIYIGKSLIRRGQGGDGTVITTYTQGRETVSIRFFD